MTYADELRNVPAAFREGLTAGRRTACPPDRPLVAVGSGGSFSAATLLADLHQATTGQVARPMTPQALLHHPPSHAVVVLCTASGRNPDAVAVGERIRDLGAERVIVLTGRHDSPVRATASSAGATVVDFPLHEGEGFVATTSLASLTGIAAGWYLDEGEGDAVPATIDQPWWSVPVDLWEAETILLLHGTSTGAAAIDLESKFVESRLGQIQVSDHRSFTHGRFHWPMTHPGSAALVLADQADIRLARRTAASFPSTLPTSIIEVPAAGPMAAVVGLLGAVHLVADVGRARGVDPGHTPEDAWGRQAYLDPGLGEVDVRL